MWPTIAEVHTSAGTVGVHTYGLFIVLAFSAAFLSIHLRAPKVGIHPDRLVGGYVSAAVGGLLGGRLLYALAVEPERTFSDPMSLMSCAGFAVYGGVIGGAIGVAIFARSVGLSLWKIADLAMPAVVLGMGVGRIGCFFAGCCHGIQAPIDEHAFGLLPDTFTGGQLWVSSQFPFLTNEVNGGVGRLLHLPLYPTQLWSFAVNTSIAALLLWHWPRRRFDGQSAALALLVEPPFRIFIETFRSDDRGYVVSWEVTEELAKKLPGLASAGAELGQHVIGVTTSQGLGLGFMAVGAVIWAVRRRAGRDDGAAPVVSDGDLLEDLT